MEEPWYQRVDREASERLAAELAKPDAAVEDDLGAEGIFDPWALFPAFYGSYASNFDECALDILREVEAGTKQRHDLGAEMFREMLCTAHFCDYGTSPRVCYPTEQFKALLPELIRRWEVHRKMQWKE